MTNLYDKIEADAIRLKKAYKINKLLCNSFNGTIYKGTDLKRNCGVILKKIPRSAVVVWYMFNGQPMPSEIFFHYAGYGASKMVVKPIDWFDKADSYMLVMEDFEGSVDLFDCCNEIGVMSEDVVKMIFQQIVQCVQEMDAAGIVHGDIKDENVLINPETLEVKIIDFGHATTTQAILQGRRGTASYLPPEFYATGEYTPDSLNVWTLGAILYILLTSYWNCSNGIFIRNSMAEGRLSKNAKELIDAMLQLKPSNRTRLETILDFSFFN